MYKQHDDLKVRIYKIDRGGTKKILGPVGARCTPAGKNACTFLVIFGNKLRYSV